jgi:hypothetical protein
LETWPNWSNINTDKFTLIGVNIMTNLGLWDTVVCVGVALVNIGTTFVALGTHGDSIKKSVVTWPVSVAVAFKASLAYTIVSTVGGWDNADGVMVALVGAGIADTSWIGIGWTVVATRLVETGLGNTVVVVLLTFINVDASLWSIFTSWHLVADQERVAQDKLRVAIAMVPTHTDAIVLALALWIELANGELVALVGALGTYIIGIGVGAADVGSKGVNTTLASSVACVVGQALVGIVATFLAPTTLKVGLLVTIAVKAIEADTVVTLFVVVRNAGGKSITGVSTVVTGLADDTLLTLVLFAVEPALGIDTGFVVRTVVTVSHTLVQVSAGFTIADVAPTTGALKCKFSAAKGTDGVGVAVVRASWAAWCALEAEC